MKTLVVLPSYNESENIVNLIADIFKLYQDINVCVVDDNSPDKTYELVQKYKDTLTNSNRLHLILRKKKDGRGGAVRDGIFWGIGNGYDCFIEMDCDFSHHPDSIAKGISLLKEYDVVLGSRYPDGEIIGWPLKRRIFSFFANLIARFLISWKISDYTNGFRFYNLKAAKVIVQNPQVHKGYIFLSETLSYFLKNKLRVACFPIRFVNRVRGESNTSFKEIGNALLGIFQIAWSHHFGKKP